MVPVVSGDAIANRAAISLTQAQLLVSSWLPPSEGTKPEANSDEEDDHAFRTVPELQGLGSKVKDDGQHEKEAAGKKEDLELKKRLFGKRKRQDALSSPPSKYGAHGGSKPRPLKVSEAMRKKGSESDGDEEVGRSGIGKIRRNNSPLNSTQTPLLPRSPPKGVQKASEGSASSTSEPESLKPQNHLEEALDGKRRRKRKKKKRKGKSKQGQDQVAPP